MFTHKILHNSIIKQKELPNYGSRLSLQTIKYQHKLVTFHLNEGTHMAHVGSDKIYKEYNYSQFTIEPGWKRHTVVFSDPEGRKLALSENTHKLTVTSGGTHSAQ